MNEYHRLHLVRLATEDDNRIKASDIEFGLPKPSYTINTLAYLAEKYPEHEFCIIMGSDSFQNLHKWKNYEVIVKELSNICVYTARVPGRKQHRSLQSPSPGRTPAPIIGYPTT